MPLRVDRVIASTFAHDPRAKLVYIDAVREDAYFLSQEDGRTVLFVHPMHRPMASSLVAAHATAS